MTADFRLSHLQQKDVIDLQRGKNYGKLCDIDTETESGRILRIVLPGTPKFFGFLGRENDLEIRWEQIRLIGEDVILVDLGEDNSTLSHVPPA